MVEGLANIGGKIFTSFLKNNNLIIYHDIRD